MINQLNKYGTVEENVNLRNHNTYKIGGSCKYMIHPKSVNELIDLIDYLKTNNIEYIILGSGSNVILSDQHYDGVVITFKEMSNYIIDELTYTIYAESGALLKVIALESINKSLKGLEFAAGIPGTVGGSIYGNAGAYNSSIMDYVSEVTVLDENLNIVKMKNLDIDYNYRTTLFKSTGKYIILAARFQLELGDKENSLQLINDRQKRRIETQPLEYPSAGSVFRNPEGDFAGRLIEFCNLKGKKVGGAMVSEKHANFIVNYDNATSKDIYNLIKEVHDIVLEKTGVDLLIEQEFIGWK